MGFKQGGFAKIWKLENKGNYHVAEMSTSKKNKNTDQYETDWSNKFVRLVGTAHNQADKLDITHNVKIGACEVTNKYDKDKNTTYTNYVVFGFEENDKKENGTKNTTPKPDPSAKTDGYYPINESVEDDDLPF